MFPFTNRPSWGRKAKESPAKPSPGDIDAADTSFTEDLTPDETGPFSEPKSLAPSENIPFELVKDKTTPDAVRRDLALPILWFLLSTYALTIGGFLFLRLLPGEQPIFSAQDFTASIAAISGLQGLAAAVVGFYFGVKHGEK